MRAALLVALLAPACATAGREQPAIDAAPADQLVPPIDQAPPIDMPSMSSCITADTCPTAMVLGAVSGDTNNQKLTSVGTKAAWFRVLVTENDNDVIGISQRFAARVTSPAAVDFDVFVYLNPSNRVVECTNTFGTKTQTGTVDEIKAEWGESGAFSNGSNDGRDVSIEIRPVSGNCNDAQMWQLEVEGNWN
jgi:hypothetical protein